MEFGPHFGDNGNTGGEPEVRFTLGGGGANTMNDSNSDYNQQDSQQFDFYNTS